MIQLWISQHVAVLKKHLWRLFFGTPRPLFKHFFFFFFFSLNMTKIPRLEASIDPESSDDSESLKKKALQELELNIY